jgi:hypothetical protein
MESPLETASVETASVGLASVETASVETASVETASVGVVVPVSGRGPMSGLIAASEPKTGGRVEPPHALPESQRRRRPEEGPEKRMSAEISRARSEA